MRATRYVRSKNSPPLRFYLSFSLRGNMEEKKKKKKKKNAVPLERPPDEEVDEEDDDRRHGIGRCAASTIFCAAAAAVLSLFVLVAALTVFKPYDPTVTLVSVDVKRCTPSLTFLPGGGGVRVNVTLQLDLLVQNPNRERFRHEPGTVRVRYRGGVVGEAEVARGAIPGRASAHVNCMVTVVGAGFAERLSQLLEDVRDGAVRFEASSRIVGKTMLLGFIGMRSVAAWECQVDVAFRLSRFWVVRHRCRR